MAKKKLNFSGADKFLESEVKKNEFKFVAAECAWISSEEGKLVCEGKNFETICNSDNGEVNWKSSDEGIRFNCEKDKLTVQGKLPVFSKDPVVPIDEKVGCKHHPQAVLVTGDGAYTNPAGGTTGKVGLRINLPDMGVKIEDKKAYVVDDSKLLVKTVACGGNKMVVVGDKIAIKHKFKKSNDAAEMSSITLNGFMRVPTSMVPGGFSVQLKTSSGKTASTFVSPTLVPPNVYTTFISESKSEMAVDGIDDGEVVVDSAITKNGSSTNCYAEGKLIALKGCGVINDSAWREECLKTDKG